MCVGILIALCLSEIASRLFMKDCSPAYLSQFAPKYVSALLCRHVFPQERQTIRHKQDPAILKFSINSLGYRGEEFSSRKPAGVFRIVVVGGSAVFDLYSKPDEDWPHLIQRRLREKGYVAVECINAGVPSHASFDSFGRLFGEIHTFSPDVVLFYNSWNDAKTLHHLGSGGTLLRHQAAGRSLIGDPRTTYRSGWDRLLCSSRLYCWLRKRFIGTIYGLDTEGGLPSEQVALDVGRVAANDGTWVAFCEPFLDQFRFNFLNLVDCARNARIEPVIVTPARLMHAGNTPAEQARVKTKFIGIGYPRIVDLFEQIDDQLRRVAREKNCLLLDISAKYSGRADLLADHIHLTPEGGRVVAREAADFIEQHFKEALTKGRTVRETP